MQCIGPARTKKKMLLPEPDEIRVMYYMALKLKNLHVLGYLEGNYYKDDLFDYNYSIADCYDLRNHVDINILCSFYNRYKISKFSNKLNIYTQKISTNNKV